MVGQYAVSGRTLGLDTLRPRQNGRHFADDIFKFIFLNETVWMLLDISLKFIPEVQINNIPALVQIMAWRRPGDKPLSEPMMVRFLTHICVTRPQWVKTHLRVTIIHLPEIPYFLLLVWIRSWENSREANYLRRQKAHVTSLWCITSTECLLMSCKLEFI